MRYADVIVDISLKQLDRTFQYQIPEELRSDISVGTLVSVPFGKGGRTVGGFVLSLSDEAKIDEALIKDIAGVQKNSVTAEQQMILIAEFISRNYGSTMAQALRTVMPIRRKVKKRGTAGTAGTVLTVPTKRGTAGTVPTVPPPLTPAQKTAVDTVLADWQNNILKNYLLHGVTGSGKTEVYMRFIEEMISQGRETIVLIPEIALTYQTVTRFTERFGDDVVVMHSRLSAGEKYEQFERAKSGDAKVCVGPRSALFTPFQNLGLIIIDEEHESSYKSDKMPKYHAREVALYRASIANATVILGSATPSVETFERMKNGEFTYLSLPNRVENRPLPKAEIVDLRAELKSGNRDILSRSLQEKIEDRLQKNERVMLFLNRRGMLSSVTCRSCGNVIKCPHCDVALSLHRGKKLVCHYCGFTTTSPEICPKCGSKYIGGFKAGTEMIEEKVQTRFPTAKILRMDADTTKGKHGHETILRKFENGKADILIGTQMIVKGHDFPDVTLVGILAADMSLNANDFRGAERTFQLCTQAAGRAGRGERAGDVVIQTYQPEHYAIKASAAQNYELFFEHEIAYRKLMKYPPVSHILLVTVLSKSEKRADAEAEKIVAVIRKKAGGCAYSGPRDAAIKRVSDIYRKIIYLKAEKYDKLVRVKDFIETFWQEESGHGDASLWFDFDPMNGF